MLENDSSAEILVTWGLTVMMSLGGINEGSGRGLCMDLDDVTQFTEYNQEPLVNHPQEEDPYHFTSKGSIANIRKGNLL